LRPPSSSCSKDEYNTPHPDKGVIAVTINHPQGAEEDDYTVEVDGKKVTTIEGLSPREQDVIRMRFVDGLTQVEIAERLGVSQVQVSRLLRRTLRRIQDKIDPEGRLA